MKKIKVQKSADHSVVESYSIPVVFVSMLQKLLPQAALGGLKDKGFDLQRLILAADAGEAYDETFEIVEHGRPVHVNVTLCN